MLFKNYEKVKLTTKVDINLGYGCNAKCPFCYYYDSVITKENQENLTTEEAKERLRLAQQYGVEEIEFTGGEVTLRKDFIELVSYAKQELKFKVVCMITNGIVLANLDYMEKLVAAGMDDILFSVHGHNAELHDRLTVTPGSFKRIMQAIDNAIALGIRVRTNTVVCQINYQHLDDIFQLLIGKRVDNLNVVMFNPIIQANNLDVIEELYVNYVDACVEIKRAIDNHQHHLPHLNIRYLPYCYLPGYEQYIINYDQMNFEPDEWNNYVSFRLRKGRWISWGTTLLGILNLPFKRVAWKYGMRGLLMAGFSRFYVLKDKVKSSKCHECSHNKVCDYIWKEYYDRYGDEEITPISGKKIDHPAWSMNAARIRQPGVLPPTDRSKAIAK